MSTTPEQLRLAADIIEKGLPYEFLRMGDQSWIGAGYYGPLHYLSTGHEIRIKPLTFPPKPEGMEWHNPDNLTADQVGDGWRLIMNEERKGEYIPSLTGTPAERKAQGWSGGSWDAGLDNGSGGNITYRVPISTPFPDSSRIVDGKLVKPEPEWIDLTVAEALRKELQPGQKVIWRDAFRWKDDKGVLSNHYEGQSLPYIAGEHGYTIIKDAGCAGIIVDKDWKPEPPKPVPLEAADVPPGSAIKLDHERWAVISSVSVYGITYGPTQHTTAVSMPWEMLADNGYKILRPGKTEWEACSKLP